MTQQPDISGDLSAHLDQTHPSAFAAPIVAGPSVTNPVHATLLATSEHYRFMGSANTPIGIKRMTIALRGATSYHLSIPHRSRADATVDWDVTLAIQPGISEATVTIEDHAGNRTTVRRLLIARAFAAPTGVQPQLAGDAHQR